MASSDANESKQYPVSGQLFFGSIARFTESFNYSGDPQYVAIDFHQAQVWDFTAATAISKVIARYQKLDKHVIVLGLSQESQSFMLKVGFPENAIF